MDRFDGKDEIAEEMTMFNSQHTSAATSKTSNRSFLILMLPLLSCLFASVVGIVLGQMGNLFYLVLGDSANCLALPGFCGLFLVTFGFSFLSNKLLRKWLKKSTDRKTNG